MFVGLGVSGVGPILDGISIYGYFHLDERMGLNWVILQGFLYILGAFIYAVCLLFPSLAHTRPDQPSPSVSYHTAYSCLIAYLLADERRLRKANLCH